VAVYALFVPSARRPVADLELEVFASRELAGRMLQRRVLTGISRTFYLRHAGRRFAEHPERAWPVWDETGYYRVWLRKAADPVPDLLSRPDEEWLIRETGSVERLPWVDGAQTLALSATGERALSNPAIKA
jgi:hypothetical protein